MPGSPELISFADFADRVKKLSAMMRAGFEVHVKDHLGNFNFRSEHDWEQAFRAFAAQDRRRRVAHA